MNAALGAVELPPQSVGATATGLTGTCILLFLCGCATSHKLEAHEEATFHEEQHSEASGEKHEGPVTITTTTEEYAYVDDVDAGGGGAGREPDGGVHTLAGDVGRREGPLVVKRTVTVEQHGPIDEAWRASGSGLTGAETHAAIKTEDKTAPSSGCALGLGFWLAVGLGLLAFGGWVWLKRSLP